jgi:hypothetical protein
LRDLCRQRPLRHPELARRDGVTGVKRIINPKYAKAPHTGLVRVECGARSCRTCSAWHREAHASGIGFVRYYLLSGNRRPVSNLLKRHALPASAFRRIAPDEPAIRAKPAR